MNPARGDRKTAHRPSARDLAVQCARLAASKKAEEIVILEVGKFLVVTDYFVICHGKNRRQIHAIVDAILKDLRAAGVDRRGLEGYHPGNWVLLDYGDVVVQVFDRETRDYYDLEVLWGDAPRVDWREGVPAEDVWGADPEDRGLGPAE